MLQASPDCRAGHRAGVRENKPCNIPGIEKGAFLALNMFLISNSNNNNLENNKTLKSWLDEILSGTWSFPAEFQSPLIIVDVFSQFP